MSSENLREGLENIIAKYHHQVPFADEVPEILSHLKSQIEEALEQVEKQLFHYPRWTTSTTIERYKWQALKKDILSKL